MNREPKKFMLKEEYIKQMGDKKKFNKEMVKLACMALAGVVLLSGAFAFAPIIGNPSTGPLAMGGAFGGLPLTISSVISMIQAMRARNNFKKYFENAEKYEENQEGGKTL